MSESARIIAGNLSRLHEAIDLAAGSRAVRLVCVTKYATLEQVEELLEAGASELGENLLPSAAERFRDLQERGYSFVRHLIGAQQSRKLRDIPGNFDLFQALDRMKTAMHLQKELSKDETDLDVLLQVNISREAQKSGFLPEELDVAVERIRQDCPALHIRGLMAIPAGPESYTGTQEFTRETSRAFGQMRALFDRICTSFPAADKPFDILSQGMSQDYKLALAEGANMIRIGSALFAGLEGK